MRELIKGARHWILLLLVTDGAFVFVTWILRREALKYMSLFLALFTLLMATAGLGIEYRRRQKAGEAFDAFLESPGERTRRELLRRFGNPGGLGALCGRLQEQERQITEKRLELSEYREYIEAWVHEAKTPLSLSTLVLENHREEMSPYVYGRMHYIQRQLNEDVERILYYARLNTEHPDYKFIKFRLDACVEEVMEEYRSFLEEKGIAVEQELKPLSVVSDRKVACFILSQLFSNAVKYAGSSQGKILLSMEQREGQVRFAIYNNGNKVPPEDMPFLFDKGFTGSHPSRQKATGMGLYLVKKYGERLGVEVGLAPDHPFEGGLGVEVLFWL